MSPATGDLCRRINVLGMKLGHRRQRRFKLQRLKLVQKVSHVSSTPEGDGVDRREASAVGKRMSHQSPENGTVLRPKPRELRLSADDLWTSTLSHGSVSVIGRRREMEDRVRVELRLLESGYDFFGVYDGHGGAQVAQACAKRLHELVADRAVADSRADRADQLIDWPEVMKGSFETMDREVMTMGGGCGTDSAVRTVGSTAVVALVGKDEVVVANCGDSRAVMWRGGEAAALSDDHKPGRPDELRRIEAAGGRVINWNGSRVLGVLATSRSIGDQYLKPFVTSVPEVTVIKRSESDEFIVLASDGLWDVVSNEYACEVVRRCLSGRMRRRSRDSVAADDDNCASEAAKILAELAMARGSGDNISVIVVELNKPRIS